MASGDYYLGTPGLDVVEIDGRLFDVAVHWAVVDGRTIAVGLDLRTFENRSKLPLPDPKHPRRAPRWREITTTTLRSVKVPELAEASRKDMFLLGMLAQVQAPTPAGRVAGRRTQRAASEPERKRGRQPLLSREELERIVLPAYVNGRPYPVEAVRLELEKHLPDRISGGWTREHAKKAIDRARKAGLPVPPYRSVNK